MRTNVCSCPARYSAEAAWLYSATCFVGCPVRVVRCPSMPLRPSSVPPSSSILSSGGRAERPFCIYTWAQQEGLKSSATNLFCLKEYKKVEELLVGFEILSHFIHCKVIGSLQCALAGLQHLAHFLVFHVVKIAQGEHGTLHVGQGSNGFLE